MPKRAREVLRYFLRNPQATDSLEGVARWRLLEETIHQSVEDTDGALRWLVDQGFLTRESKQLGADTYRLNHDRAAEGARLLAEVAGSGASEPSPGRRRKALRASPINRGKDRPK